jgi:hypothetical protein
MKVSPSQTLASKHSRWHELTPAQCAMIILGLENNMKPAAIVCKHGCNCNTVYNTKKK